MAATAPDTNVRWKILCAQMSAKDTVMAAGMTSMYAITAVAGALFCDRRYDTVFVYHNGAESYHAARGFRCSLRV